MTGRSAYRTARRLCALVTVVTLIAATRPVAHAASHAQQPDASDAGSSSIVEQLVLPRAVFEPRAQAVAVVGSGSYRGTVEVLGEPGGLVVVNEVDLEDYLRGVDEVPTDWPLEAQRAQAIAARTYAVNAARRYADSPAAHICDDSTCQRYLGVEAESRSGFAAWAAAVASTEDSVVVYDGEPIKAQYSASNGGKSVDGGAPYLAARPDPDDAAAGVLHDWRARISRRSLGRLVPLSGPLVGATVVGDRVQISTRLHDGSRRTRSVAVGAFRRGLNAMFPARAGGAPLLPSDRFEVWVADGDLVIVGDGFGHGIGLSQYGALGKARRGLDAPQILEAYYAGAQTVTLPDTALERTIRVELERAQGGVLIDAASADLLADDGRRFSADEGVWDIRPHRSGLVVVVPSQTRQSSAATGPEGDAALTLARPSPRLAPAPAPAPTNEPPPLAVGFAVVVLGAAIAATGAAGRVLRRADAPLERRPLPAPAPAPTPRVNRVSTAGLAPLLSRGEDWLH